MQQVSTSNRISLTVQKIGLLLLFLFFFNSVNSQKAVLGDSLKIEFLKSGKVLRKVSSENDLNYMITVTNISKKPIMVYSMLVFDRSPSSFANYDFELYKKSRKNSQYVYGRVNNYSVSSLYMYYYDSLSSIYGSGIDSLMAIYDMPKKYLQPGYTDTLTFNVLRDNIVLDNGLYKFRVKFRTNTVFTRKNGKLAIEKIQYVNSDWYYFQVAGLMKSSRVFSSRYQ